MKSTVLVALSILTFSFCSTAQDEASSFDDHPYSLGVTYNPILAFLPGPNMSGSRQSIMFRNHLEKYDLRARAIYGVRKRDYNSHGTYTVIEDSTVWHQFQHENRYDYHLNLGYGRRLFEQNSLRVLLGAELKLGYTNIRRFEDVYEQVQPTYGTGEPQTFATPYSTIYLGELYLDNHYFVTGLTPFLGVDFLLGERLMAGLQVSADMEFMFKMDQEDNYEGTELTAWNYPDFQFSSNVDFMSLSLSWRL